MRHSLALLTAPLRLILLLLALGSGQLEAACTRFVTSLDAVSAAAVGAEHHAARQVTLDLVFIAGEDRLTQASRQSLRQLLACADSLALDRKGLLVVGYAAPSEALHTALMSLAHDRADVVARQLRNAGLTPAGIRAAQSSALDGNEDVARVELWLRD